MSGVAAPQANVVLDKAAVENYRRRSVAVAAELSSVPVPNIYKILTVLVEVQAGLQLARMYDVRQAALHRKTDGSPHISDDTINEVCGRYCDAWQQGCWEHEVAACRLAVGMQAVGMIWLLLPRPVPYSGFGPCIL